MKKFEIRLLSEVFYKKYSKSIFSEIMDKGENRPYLVLLLKIKTKTFGLPFRSNVTHKYCFKIKNNRGLKEGIDFSKAVILEAEDIGRNAHLKSGNLKEVRKHIDLIIRKFENYLNEFEIVSKLPKRNVYQERTFNMSTLKYFINMTPELYKTIQEGVDTPTSELISYETIKDNDSKDNK